MTLLLAIFAGMAALMWLSLFGYLLALRLVAARRSPDQAGSLAWPAIVVIVPVLDEVGLVVAKLRDLERCDYPGAMRVLVVDGGSRDGTADLVQREIDRGVAVDLVKVREAHGKSDQLNHALRMVEEDIVVVTDVDARLAPDCVPELVRALLRDPRAAVMGALIIPDTSLLEERLHWWMVNRLWWLEGEALSAAVVSGVCYAARRAAIRSLPSDAIAEDAHLALVASAGGFRTRLCPTALATEVRVPLTRREFVRFRRRRGSVYAHELLRRAVRAPAGWRLARAVRLWHVFVTPKILACLVVLAIALLATPHWRWPVAVLLLYSSSLALLFRQQQLGGAMKARWWMLAAAAVRLLALTWIALVTMPGDSHATALEDPVE